MTKEKIHPEVTCPICDTVFIKDRSNKKYCSRKCQAHSARKDRTEEYRKRNEEHYGLAGRLKQVLDTLPEKEYHLLIQTILRTASVGYAKLRNVLLDPRLLKQQQSVALQVKIYCIEYFKTDSEDAILNFDRSYSKTNYINSVMDYTLKRNYPAQMSKEEVTNLEDLLYDLWDMEREVRRKNAKDNGDYYPLNTLEDEVFSEGNTRSGCLQHHKGEDEPQRKVKDIVYVEIEGCLPEVEVKNLDMYYEQDHYDLYGESLIDDDDDWDVEYQYVVKKKKTA